MKLKTTSSRKKLNRRRRVPSPRVHTNDSFSLSYEDLHSARRFKPMHFMFLSLAFLVIAGAFSIAMIARHNGQATAEQTQLQNEQVR